MRKIIQFMHHRIHRPVLGLCVLVFLFLAYRMWALPEIPPVPAPSKAVYEWPIVRQPWEEHWLLFQQTRGSGGEPAENRGPLAKTYRLAGTFFVYDDSGSEQGNCKAVIDHIAKKEQYLVGEGEQFENVDVVRIFRDHILLRSGGQDEELWLSFSGEARSDTAAAPASSNTVVTMDNAPALESNRFGKRVGDTRWVLKRDELMRYYQELMDDPERLASLFISMKPDYQESSIAGYAIDMVGEKDFFKNMGLANGDVVRRVNSMKMTSQARAEYFIGEFMKNRVNAFVLDIEREGEPKKLIYMVR